MSNLAAFSLDSLQPEPPQDIQLKLLNNALTRFCDRVELDNCTVDEERNVTTREVIWFYGKYVFRAKLITFDNDTSIGQYDFSDGQSWQRLTTPRALAEKLAHARELYETA
jgi:hypothetical protein